MKEQIKNKKILYAWCISWVASFSLLLLGTNYLWHSLLITKIGLLINLAIGIGMIIANKNLFKTYDELQKKIQYEAIAITLGLTVVVGITYDVSCEFSITKSELEFEYIMFFMCFIYLASIIINSLRYR